MRINLTLGNIDPFGGNRTWWYVSDRLLERGHDVSILLSARQPLFFEWKARIIYASNSIPHDYKTLQKSLSVAHHSLKGLSNLRLIQSLLAKLWIRSSTLAGRAKLASATPDCDINVASFFTSAFTVYESGKGIPLHHHHQHLEEVFIPPRYEYMKHVFRKSLFLPIYNTTNSIWCRQQLKLRYGLDVPIINHAPFITPDRNPPHKMKRQYSKVVLAFGKDDPIKGFDDACECMRIVMNRRKDVEFWVYGARPITVKTHDLRYRFFLNPSDDELASLYSTADVFISTSWYESFPAPPIEAMAFGCPVVTTRYGTEDYTIDGENSLVVPPREPQSMASAVLRLLEDDELSSKFRKTGPETARRFTWDKTVDKFEALFEKLLAHDIKLTKL